MKLLTLTLMLVFSIVVLAIGMPPLEISRQEARLAQAYHQAKQIKDGTLPHDTLDPWGSPFTIIKDGHRQIVRVVSLGENRSTLPSGLDADDVASDMSIPRHHTLMRNRDIQLLAALSLSASPWFISAAAFLLSFFRRSRPPSKEIGVRSRNSSIT